MATRKQQPKLTKRQDKALARAQEKQAVSMFLVGKRMKIITSKTTVPGWIVRGLVVAHTLNNACR